MRDACLAIDVLAQAIQVFDANLNANNRIPNQIGGWMSCPVNVVWLLKQRIVQRVFGIGEVEIQTIGPGSDHPTVGWKSHQLEQAIVEDLARLRLPTPEIAAWFRTAIEASLADLLSHQPSGKQSTISAWWLETCRFERTASFLSVC